MLSIVLKARRLLQSLGTALFLNHYFQHVVPVLLNICVCHSFRHTHMGTLNTTFMLLISSHTSPLLGFVFRDGGIMADSAFQWLWSLL